MGSSGSKSSKQQQRNSTAYNSNTHHPTSTSQQQKSTTSATTTTTTSSAQQQRTNSFSQQQQQSVKTTTTTTTGTTTTTSSSASTTTSSAKKGPSNELETLFEKYQKIDEHTGESGDDADYVGGDGIIQFVQDLGIDPMDVLVLMMLYKIDSKVQYKITRREWMNGFSGLAIHNMEDMKHKIPQIKNQLSATTKTFKQFYSWVFNYVKEPDQKGMAVETACATWRVVLAGHFALLDDWCNFVQVEVGKAVQKDTWDLFYDFIVQVGDNLSQFDEGGAWPVAVDEFVAWMNEGKNVAVRERLEKERAEQQELGE